MLGAFYQGFPRFLALGAGNTFGERPCPLLCERFFPKSRVKRLRPSRTLATKSHYSHKPK